MFSPNSSGSLIDPQYIVVHGTVSGSFKSAYDWLMNKASKASAHELIGRDAEWAQLVPYDKCAWHCGQSFWDGKTGLNKYSIGIELVSWGPLTDDFKSATYPSGVVTGELYYGAPTGFSYKWWQGFTPVQLLKLEERIVALMSQFPSLKEVVGHRDISPGRKPDPWPLDAREVFKRFKR